MSSDDANYYTINYYNKICVTAKQYADGFSSQANFYNTAIAQAFAVIIPYSHLWNNIKIAVYITFHKIKRFFENYKLFIDTGTKLKQIKKTAPNSMIVCQSTYTCFERKTSHIGYQTAQAEKRGICCVYCIYESE